MYLTKRVLPLNIEPHVPSYVPYGKHPTSDLNSLKHSRVKYTQEERDKRDALYEQLYAINNEAMARNATKKPIQSPFQYWAGVGGQARAQSLSKQQRSAIASNAAKARHNKKGK